VKIALVDPSEIQINIGGKEWSDNMLFKSLKIFLAFGTIFIVLFISFIAFGNGNIENEIINTKLPQYPEAFSIKKGFDPKTHSSYLAYKVKINFPARKVINYYDSQLSALGFFVFNDDGYGVRDWTYFNSSKGKWEKTDKVPARYISTWVDRDRTMRLILMLDYSFDEQDIESKDKDLFIDCRLTKFFDFREIKQKIEE